MCPSKPFPMLIGAPGGETKLLCMFSVDDIFFVGGTSSAPTMNGNQAGVLKPIYHSYQVQDQAPVFRKYIESTTITEIVAIKKYNDGLVLLSNYPHHLFRVSSTTGQIFKEFVIVASDNSAIDIILDTQRPTNNHQQMILSGYIAGAQQTQIIRIQDTFDPDQYTYEHSWTLNSGTNLEVQAISTFSPQQVFCAVLKYEQSSQFHYGFVDVVYDSGTNTQRYLETQGVAQDYDLIVGVYKTTERDLSAFLGYTSDKTKIVGFSVDFANSEIKSFETSQTGSALYPILIRRSALELEFSYTDGETVVYMKLNVDSTSIISKTYSNFISAGQTITSRIVWQATINASGHTGQVVLSHGTQIGHRTYAQTVSQISIVNENLNCLKDLTVAEPTITATWTDYTETTSQSNFVIGHDITRKSQDSSYGNGDATANSDFTKPCEIELDMSLASSQSFHEYTSNTFALTTQCVELSGCGSTLTEELTTPQFGSFPSCLTYDNAGTVSVTACQPEGNYDINFRCEMEGEELTDTQALTITNNDLELTTCTATFSVNQHQTWTHDLVLAYQQSTPTVANPSFSAFDTSTSSLPSFMSENSSGTTTTIGATPVNCAHVGSFSLQVDAQDTDLGSSTSCAFTLTVTAVNQQPSLASALTDQVYQLAATGFNQDYTLPAYQDADPSDVLTASFTVDGTTPPSWITLSGGVFTINTADNSEIIGVKTHNGANYDPFVVELTLTDSNPCTASNGVLTYSESFNLRLNPFNHVPVIDPISDVFTATYVYQYIPLPNITDADPNDSHTFALLNKADMLSITNAIPGVTLDLANNQISIEVDDDQYEAVYQLRFQVTDDDTVLEGQNKASYVDFQLVIGPFNFAPEWATSFDSLEFEMMNYQEESITLPSCQDLNPSDTLTPSYIYTQNGGPEVSSLGFIKERKQNERFYIDIEPTDVWHVGKFTVCVTCTDDDSVSMGEIKQVSDCFEFQIKGKNNAPEIDKELSDVSILVNETYTYQFPGYSDKDQYDSFEESVTVKGAPLPGFIQMSSSGDGSGPRLTIEPTLETHAGQYEISYLVEDSNSERGEEGSLSDQTAFVLTVEMPEIVEEESTEEEGEGEEGSEEGESEENEEGEIPVEQEFNPSTYVFEWPKTKVTEPKPKIQSISEQGEVVISWNQKMAASDAVLKTSNKREIVQILIISFSNQDANSNLVSYEMTAFSETEMTIQLEFQDPLLVSATEEDLLRLYFTEEFFLSKESRLTNEKFKEIEGFVPQQLDSGMAAQVEAIEDSAQTTKGIMSALFGMNFFLSFFVSTVLNMIWTLVNSLQLIMTLPLMTVEFPSNAFMISQIVNQVVNFNILPVATINGFLFSFKEDKPVKNSYFREYSFENYAMIQNLELLFYIFVGIILTAIVLKILSKFCVKRKKQVQKLTQFLIDFTLRFTIESYLEFLLSALTNIQQLNWNTFGESLSSVLAISFTALLLLLPFLIYRYLKAQFKKSVQRDEKGSVLFSEQKQTSRKAFMFNYYFILRRMTHALSLCFLYQNTVLQSQAIFTITFATECYIIANRPFKASYLNNLEILNEFFLHLLSYFCVLFGGLVSDQEVQFQLGWYYIYIFCFQVIANMACILYISIMGSKRCRRRKFRKLQKKRFNLQKQKHYLKAQPLSSAVRLQDLNYAPTDKLTVIASTDIVQHLKPKGKKRKKMASVRRQSEFILVEKYRTVRKESDMTGSQEEANSDDKVIDLLA